MAALYAQQLQQQPLAGGLPLGGVHPGLLMSQAPRPCLVHPVMMGSSPAGPVPPHLMHMMTQNVLALAQQQHAVAAATAAAMQHNGSSGRFGAVRRSKGCYGRPTDISSGAEDVAANKDTDSQPKQHVFRPMRRRR